jgi:large subunit ribosomal protein L25
LEVKERKETGTRQVKNLRKEGWIPGVIYGHGEKSKLIKVREEDLKNLIHDLRSEATLLTLNYEGEKLQVLPREVTRNPLDEKLLHVDFQHIHEDEEVSVHVIIEFQGKPKGAEDGGVTNIEHRDLIVRCLPKDIPEKIVVDISALEIGHSIHIKDLVIPEGIKVEEDPSVTVVNVLSPRKLIEVKPVEVEIPVGEEVPAEPEVISKGEGEIEGEGEVEGEVEKTDKAEKADKTGKTREQKEKERGE